MKNISQSFKENIKEMGRELDSKITYMFGGTELGNSELNSVTPIFQTSLLKSVMKELDIDSNVNIPIGMIINYKFGVSLNGSEYEYIDYGNYIVYSSEKQEDTNSYKIVCYDYMLNSMKDYEKLQSASLLSKGFPMTVREYLTYLCTDIGLTFKNRNDTFANYNKIINGDLYADLGYTYRDILDELAQVTASNIVINDDGQVEIRYINNTYDTINEEYLKDVNVNFGEKYGPVNSIVLSRAAESDNVYLQDEQSIQENGLCEIKISENQIMNFNDRSDYLYDILQKLDGLEYYMNDFASTGICYYDVCDKYYVQIDEETYPCIMFNSQINVSQGLEETVFTDLPEEAETDYTKSDKTDRRINQTYLIVDKQNQTIEGVVNQVDGQNEKISRVLQTVDEINQKVSATMDITISGETMQGMLELDKINRSEPITIKIRPRIESISYLYPNNNLFPSNELYLKRRIIRFKNTQTGEIFDYELPDDLLYYDVDHYDEFYLSYGNQVCQIIKKCGYREDGSIYLLDKTQIIDYPYPTIELTDGDYEISVLGYNTAYLYITLMAQNIYTSQFATKIELNSSIKQTNDKIELEVSQVEKVLDEEVRNFNSQITQTAKEISTKVSSVDGGKELASLIRQTSELIYFQANNFGWKSNNSEMTTDGKITAKAGEIGGFNMNSTSFSKGLNGIYNYTEFDLQLLRLVLLGHINISRDSSMYNILDISNEGELNSLDLVVMRQVILGQATDTKVVSGNVSINSNNPKNCLVVRDNNNNTTVSIGLGGVNSKQIVCQNIVCADNTTDTSLNRYIALNGIDGNIYASGTISQGSREEIKKNFEKLNNALSIINDIDIYKYNYKTESDDDKKHIGFVIGDKYKYSNEITTLDNEGKEVGVDTYSMTSLCLQAIKEQQEQIETLKKEISLLKKESDK